MDDSQLKLLLCEIYIYCNNGLTIQKNNKIRWQKSGPQRLPWWVWSPPSPRLPRCNPDSNGVRAVGASYICGRVDQIGSTLERREILFITNMTSLVTRINITRSGWKEIWLGQKMVQRFNEIKSNNRFEAHCSFWGVVKTTNGLSHANVKHVAKKNVASSTATTKNGKENNLCHFKRRLSKSFKWLSICCLAKQKNRITWQIFQQAVAVLPTPPPHQWTLQTARDFLLPSCGPLEVLGLGKC